MSFSGSGVFNINTSGQPVVAGTLIEATVFNALTADLAAGLSNCLTKDGQQTVTGDIAFNGFKLLAVAPGVLRTDGASIATIQDGTGTYVATVAGTADAITLAPAQAIPAYVAGQTLRFIASGANTGAVTVNVSAQGVKDITKSGSTALSAGDIVAGAMVEITYDGTRFQLGDVPSSGGGGGVSSSAIQLQTHVFFLTAGASTAYTLTPSPPIASYVIGTKFAVKFHVASGAAPTLAISGIAAPPNLVKQVTAGTFSNIAAADIPINHVSDVTLLSATQALVHDLPPLNAVLNTLADAKGDIFAATAADAVARLAVGTNGKVLTADSTQTTGLSWSTAAGGITLGTPVTTTSGTTKAVTGIPAGTKRIEITFAGVSTNGITDYMLQLGDSGGIEATGYVSGVNDSAGAGHTSTTAFLITEDPTASDTFRGILVLTLENSSTNTWVLAGKLVQGTSFHDSAGTKSLSAVLTQLLISSVGADTFDAGEFNITTQG